MRSFETFLQLHHDSTPFLLGNVWDASSAKVFERNGFQAIGTSSAAIAHAQGYNDGEDLPFDVLLETVKRISRQINIPLSVDIEAGYSRSLLGIINNIEKLLQAGVVGINIEDTVVEGGNRRMQPVEDFQKILSAIAEHLSKNNIKLFINARTDTFLMGMPDARKITLERVKAYENAGANGIFVPCITDHDDIREVVGGTKLPVNVMCMPALPDFETLASLGVKRISMGNFVHDTVTTAMGKIVQTIQQQQSFKSLFQ